ncbi:hypothetical protein [Streptomyces sp. NPDC058665]|uniref:hypothetical protein n=1 Tax=Streptomyces sp. NPDC058665 TaxID=3346586 RepID=UPI0036460165
MESTNTPEPASRPSPRLMAARPPRPGHTGLPASVAPAPPVRAALRHDRPAVRPGGWDRGRYEQALRHSQLSPPVRLLAWTLAHYAARSNGTIPRDDVPGTHRLAKATGLTELSARNSLLVLEREGWVTRQAPPEGQAGPPPMQLTIPAGTHLPRCPRPGPHTGGHDHHAP